MDKAYQTVNEQGLIVSFTSKAKDLHAISAVNKLGISTLILNSNDSTLINTIHDKDDSIVIGISCLKHEESFDYKNNHADFVLLPCWDLSLSKEYQENGIRVIPYCETDKDVARLKDSYDLFMINFNTQIEMKFPNNFFIINTVDDCDIKDTGYLDNVLAYVVHDNMALLDNCRSVKKAIAALLNVHLAHIGVNSESDEQANGMGNEFAKLFYGEKEETFLSFFGSNFVEVMKPDSKRGMNGHIGLGVNNVSRAVHYYTALGFNFNYDSARYDEYGNLTLIYFVEQMAGFALHLVQC